MPIAEAFAAALTGQAIGRLRERVRPNPYAPTLPDQGQVAVHQAGQLRPGTSGLAGSEMDWYTDQQGRSTVGTMGIAQDLPAYAIPPSRLIPGDPGADPADPTVLADFRSAPVRTDLPAWGRNTGTVPHAITARINPPTAKTPLPREVDAARAAGAPQSATDAWDQLYEG